MALESRVSSEALGRYVDGRIALGADVGERIKLEKKDVRDDVVEASGRRTQKKKAGSGVPGRSCVRRRVLGPLVASSPYPKGQQGVRREAKKNTKLADKPDHSIVALCGLAVTVRLVG